MRFLLEIGADPSIPDDNGQTPLELAKELGDQVPFRSSGRQWKAIRQVALRPSIDIVLSLRVPDAKITEQEDR